MTNFLIELKKKISNKINPEELLIIDNSALHTKHKSFKSDKFYLKLIIKSEKLKGMRKIDAHKTIFNILKKEMQSQIHALEIELK